MESAPAAAARKKQRGPLTPRIYACPHVGGVRLTGDGNRVLALGDAAAVAKAARRTKRTVAFP